ncbi:hypothetical protein AB1K62_14430 [Parasphingorhabdus sp. JC815]|uniref:hypothetical protein n=1 Tax=Parasphingorhabdus sp. JC815 TaxID=3232140 RepID=UPI003459DFF3
MTEPTMRVVPLHPRRDKDDLATALRNIADEIEAGDYDFDPSMAVVVLADERAQRGPDGDMITYNLQTHGIGARCSYFTSKGIMAAALTEYED